MRTPTYRRANNEKSSNFLLVVGFSVPPEINWLNEILNPVIGSRNSFMIEIEMSLNITENIRIYEREKLKPTFNSRKEPEGKRN